jgi:hypothetical protein
VALPGIFEYVSHLDGADKGNLMLPRAVVLTQLHTSFNWFRTYFLHSGRNFVDISFQDAFNSIPTYRYPAFVRKYMRGKNSKCQILKRFKPLVQYWYELIYGQDRLFDFLFDADVGLKVIVHENMLKLMRSTRCKEIPCHLVADNLVGLLEVVARGDLLVNTSNDSIINHRGCCQFLFGLLRFLPHHCDSKFGFGGKTESTVLFGTEYRSIRMISRDSERGDSFKVGDEVNVFYGMGRNKSDYDFDCKCGSLNCISLQ